MAGITITPIPPLIAEHRRLCKLSQARQIERAGASLKDPSRLASLFTDTGDGIPIVAEVKVGRDNTIDVYLILLDGPKTFRHWGDLLIATDELARRLTGDSPASQLLRRIVCLTGSLTGDSLSVQFAHGAAS